MKTKLYFRMIFILLANFISKQVYAQSNRAFETLDANNISARINVAGDHFWDFSNSAQEVPKGSGKSTIFASSLWIGGLENNNIKIAAMTYRQNGSDFWAGPLDTTDGTINAATSKDWDNIYKITRTELLDFVLYGTISNNIKNWPAYRGGTTNYTHHLAPFVDVNKDGVYNPKDGDYPDMKGDMMLWWIFNDNASTHSETGGQALKVEIHASAYAYNCTDDPLKYNSIFFDYEIYNRNSNKLDSTIIGVWTDFNLGKPDDNYIASSAIGNSYYAYNGSDTDAGSQGYGIHPPVQAVTFLNEHMNTSFYYDNNFTVNGNPEKAAHYYYYLCGHNKAGVASKTNYPLMFPDTPFSAKTFSEPAMGNKPGYRRMLGATNPISLKAGGIRKFSFAYTYYRNPYRGLRDNIALALDGMNMVSHFKTDIIDGCDIAGINEPKLEKYLHIFPNPVQAFVTVAWDEVIPQKIVISNETGQVIYGQNIETGLNNISINTAALAPGFYTLKVLSNKGTIVKKLVINN